MIIHGIKKQQLFQYWLSDYWNIAEFSESFAFGCHIRFVFALIIQQLYKTKAIELAKKILPAFNTGTGLPYAAINLKT